MCIRDSHKVDAATGEGIYGVKFVLYDAGKNPIGEYATDQDGYCLLYTSKDIPEGMIAVEVDQAVAKKLFGQTIAIHCYDNTVEHNVGTVNGQYWFLSRIHI